MKDKIRSPPKKAGGVCGGKSSKIKKKQKIWTNIVQISNVPTGLTERMVKLMLTKLEANQPQKLSVQEKEGFAIALLEYKTVGEADIVASKVDGEKLYGEKFQQKPLK